jgi:hypothetical protein
MPLILGLDAPDAGTVTVGGQYYRELWRPVAGVITFAILSLHEPGSVGPDWDTGVALGVGGLAGAYTGARLQSRLPDALIRRLVGIW